MLPCAVYVLNALALEGLCHPMLPCAVFVLNVLALEGLLLATSMGLSNLTVEEICHCHLLDVKCKAGSLGL